MDGEIQQSENTVFEFKWFKAIFAFIQVEEAAMLWLLVSTLVQNVDLLEVS